MLTSLQVTQYIRIALYWLFGALASYGVNVSDGAKQIAVAVVGTAVTLAWTAYGTRINALIAEVAKSPDVKQITTSDATAQVIPDPKVVPAGKS